MPPNTTSGVRARPSSCSGVSRRIHHHDDGFRHRDAAQIHDHGSLGIWVALSKIPSNDRMGRKLVPIEGSAYYYLENLKGLVLDVQYANADAQARVWL